VVAVVAGALVLTSQTGRGLAGVVEGLVEERGARWMIAVAFFWSATLLLDKRALESAAPQLHALVLNGGVAAGAFAALAIRGETRRLAAIRGHVPTLIGAVVVSAGALGAQLVALGAIPLGFIETVKRGLGGALAVVWGRLFFGEPVTASKLAAVALMSLGVALLLL
jgi:multidrug transporter EmrE-like cation transporter